MASPPLTTVGRGAAPLAIVLGTNEIASAVAVHLFRDGYAVVMSHDPNLPVIRRAMAFHDVLWGEDIVLDEVRGMAIERAIEIFALTDRPGGIGVTPLGLIDLMPAAPFDLLIDARMDKYAVIPDLRNLAGATIGLGPGFRVGVNCDVAVETHPDRNGSLLTEGATERADGVSRRLGPWGPERFVRADGAGRWHTSLGVGTRVFKGMVVGHLGRTPVAAPLDGVLRGIARDGAEIPAGVKILEIDPRDRRQVRWHGIDERGRTIAGATQRAAALHRLVAGTTH